MGSIPGPAQGVKDPALLWLRCRLAAAALIGPLAWELLHTTVQPEKAKPDRQTKPREPYKKPPREPVMALGRTHRAGHWEGGRSWHWRGRRSWHWDPCLAAQAATLKVCLRVLFLESLDSPEDPGAEDD